ncbi:Pls/PosA family non-ribosomal peptide synthetase [Streptomyces sp. NPDC000075]
MSSRPSGHPLPPLPDPRRGRPDRAVLRGAPAHPPRTLLDVFDATAAAYPGSPALDTGDRVLDYRALAAETDALAARLRRAGAGPGDRIGVRVPSGTAQLYVAVLAALRCGAAYVPVDADDPDERAATVFREAGVCLVLGAGGEIGPGAVPPLGAAVGAAPRPVEPGDDAWIIFTSGSTGLPKGVAVRHRSAAAFVDAEAALFLRDRPLGPGDRVLAGLSVAFDASCEEMWLAWRHGACLVPAPRSLVRAGHELGPWLVERGITVVSTVPTLAALWPAGSLDRVRLLIVGGEACPAELVDRYAVDGREMWNTYGPTETTVVACAARLHPGEPVRIGLPLDGWDLAVVDEAGEPLAVGETGELVVAGAGLARYLDPGKDREGYRPCPALGTDRAYRTGDLVRADPRGLVFAGRADDQVKLGGRRVEPGEIDAALTALTGVRAAATVVRETPAGGRLLVGYVVPGPGYVRDGAREELARRLPAALVPLLAEVPELPTRTSGKVDRDALPWPLPADPATRAPLTPTQARLAALWEDQLGIRPGPGDDFFALGGTSLGAARLASALRPGHPGISVADLYRRPVLRDMAAHADTLVARRAPRPPVRPVPRRAGLVQLLTQTASYTVTGLRGVVVLAGVDNVLGLSSPHAWTPHTPWWLVLTGWLLLFTAPSRFVLGTLAARLLTRGLRPGTYPRGGRTHLRLWAAERAVAAFGVPALLGTPWAARYARALGCATGPGAALHAMPPVTGLAEFGAGCAVEPEADLRGWWLDGDRLLVGAVRIGAGARVGHRAVLMPGAEVGEDAELAAGACLDGRIPPGGSWHGSPARPRPDAPAGRDAVRRGRAALRRPHGRLRRRAPYALSLLLLPLLPVLASLPVLLATYRLVEDSPTLGEVALRLALAAPLSVLVCALCRLALVALVVRVLGRRITPGSHPADGAVAWRVWLVHRLLDSSRSGLFPLYASLATPLWLRLLGARIGRNTEISTVLPLPSLLRVDDGAFLADDTLAAPYELRDGRMHLGAVRVGRRAFVGNSGIVGPGRHVPDGALVGVLSDAPADPAPGTSWLGRPALELPRAAASGDASRTFTPPRRLVVARAAVELCRLVPPVCGLLLAEGVFLGEDAALRAAGPLWAVGVAVPLLLAAAMAAGLTTTAAKWLLVGRFRAAEHPLWSPFVWRNELYDTFVESLAVPWLAGPFTGTPVLNWWLRTLGARIGRGVWCDTHWLPETDLVTLGDGATVNRGCVLQTHLFHDRIMRMDAVRLDAGASLGPHSIVLPGSTVGAHTSVGPASLVMRGETLPAGTAWAGNPVAGAVPATAAGEV